MTDEFDALYEKVLDAHAEHMKLPLCFRVVCSAKTSSTKGLCWIEVVLPDEEDGEYKSSKIFQLTIDDAQYNYVHDRISQNCNYVSLDLYPMTGYQKQFLFARIGKSRGGIIKLALDSRGSFSFRYGCDYCWTSVSKEKVLQG